MRITVRVDKSSEGIGNPTTNAKLLEEQPSSMIWAFAPVDGVAMDDRILDEKGITVQRVQVDRRLVERAECSLQSFGFFDPSTVRAVVVVNGDIENDDFLDEVKCSPQGATKQDIGQCVVPGDTTEVFAEAHYQALIAIDKLGRSAGSPREMGGYVHPQCRRRQNLIWRWPGG